MQNTFLKTILTVILIASFVGVFFVMSIMDLVNTRDIHEIAINRAGQLIVIENSINGIIPTGKDYYYAGVDDSSSAVYAIHAGKNWLSDIFDREGKAIEGEILIKGLSKRASDFRVEQEIASRIYAVAESSELNLGIEPGYVLELNYIRDAVLRLIAGLLILAIGIVMFVFRDRKDELPEWSRKVFLVLFILTIFFALWTIV